MASPHHCNRMRPSRKQPTFTVHQPQSSVFHWFFTKNPTFQPVTCLWTHLLCTAILGWKFLIPSDFRRQAPTGQVSTEVSDDSGTLGAVLQKILFSSMWFFPICTLLYNPSNVTWIQSWGAIYKNIKHYRIDPRIYVRTDLYGPPAPGYYFI